MGFQYYIFIYIHVHVLQNIASINNTHTLIAVRYVISRNVLFCDTNIS